MFSILMEAGKNFFPRTDRQTDRQTDQQTDRPTFGIIEAPVPELNKTTNAGELLPVQHSDIN